ncbi:MAG: sensor histidine kinase [Propionibacteriaceae bacterium]|nr:sensor histidine kinase [Propionibacteriaceae bacterium]
MDHDAAVLSNRLLNFFFVSSLLLVVGSLFRVPLAPILTTVVVIIALWVWWLRVRSRVAAWAFTAASFAFFHVANNIASLAMQWLTLIVLVLSVSQLAARCYAALIVALVLAIHLFVRSPWQVVLSNFIAAGLVLDGGLVFAALLVGAHAADQERRRALDELRIRLRDSHELALTQERERTARALHDNLGHRLTTIGVSLDYARRILPDDPTKADAELQRARQDTSDALATMRATVRAMQPIVLRDGGVVDTLEAVAHSFGSTQVDITADIADDVADEQLGLLIIRTVQEALTNSVRHSQVDHIEIHLNARQLRIADNGQGSDAAPDFGLNTLAARARAVGATLTTKGHGGIDGGYLVVLDLPAS